MQPTILVAQCGHLFLTSFHTMSGPVHQLLWITCCFCKGDCYIDCNTPGHDGRAKDAQ